MQTARPGRPPHGAEGTVSDAQLFTFVQYKTELKQGSGMWGRALRRAVTDWYNSQDGMSLAQTVTKCKHRAGWSQQDLLRLSHMKPTNDSECLLLIITSHRLVCIVMEKITLTSKCTFCNVYLLILTATTQIK